MATTFGVAPTEAKFYYCAVIEVDGGDTDYVDGYASGDMPTRTALQEHAKCAHAWVAGLMYVHDEDVAQVAATGRKVTCEKCDRPYAARNKRAYKILEWQVRRTP